MNMPQLSKMDIGDIEDVRPLKDRLDLTNPYTTLIDNTFHRGLGEFMPGLALYDARVYYQSWPHTLIMASLRLLAPFKIYCSVSHVSSSTL